MIKLSHFILGYLLFLLFGALLFYELNAIEERKQHIRVKNQIRQFINRNKKCLKEHDLYSYVDYFLDKSHTGLWLSSSSKTNTTKWTFGQGFFFVTSLITTVGYGTPNLITPFGKCLCIIYTIIGLILAIFFQQILHCRLVRILYNIIFQLSINRHTIYYSSRHRSYVVSFLCVIFLIIFVFIIIPTLIIHKIYVPEWSIIELTYFLVTTNHMIGFGDFMPCNNLQESCRSKCAIIIAVYVIIQVLTAGILSHMCCIFPSKNRQFSTQRRHNSDTTVDMIDNETFSINIDKELLIPNVYT